MLTLVDGSIAFSASSAACCGLTGEADSMLGVAFFDEVGMLRWLAVLSLLDQVHRSPPLRIRSDSPS